MMPSLRSAQVIDCWSGLRPERPLIRLETERLPSGRIWCEQVPYSDHRSFAPSRFLSLSLSLSRPLSFSLSLSLHLVSPPALSPLVLSRSLSSNLVAVSLPVRGVLVQRHTCAHPVPHVSIHNYGHGGCGMTLHWGCADKVVGLVKALGGKSKL